MSDQQRAQPGAPAPAEQAPSIEFRGGKAMSALPIGLFVIWAIVQSGVLQIGDTTGLIAGMLIALVLGMLFVRGSWTPYANAIFEGMAQRVAVTAIVAWLWAGMFAETLQAGGFVNGLVWLADAAGVGAAMFPAITFLLAGLLASGIGTGYGTTIAFVTLFFPAGVALGADPVLMFGAILSGAVFGDNLAPVSDTTIVSAVTQDADIGGVVASRFKYAVVAAGLSIVAYLIAGSLASGSGAGADAQALLREQSEPRSLLHLISMGVVILAAVRGRHIIEAISWGLIVAIVFNLIFGLAAPGDMLVFRVEEGTGAAQWLGGLGGVIQPVPKDEVGVGGSIYSGAAGFLPLSVLVLLVIAAAHIMIRGGGFAALQDWLLRVVAKTVRGAELAMVVGTACINACITINTAAQIAIAPYIRTIGQRFNLNGYRRANILDANTSALGYIFPWSGGVLVGVDSMSGLSDKYAWFGSQLTVNPAEVFLWVFHGWLLVLVFLFAAITGFGREYVTDRVAHGSSQA